MLLIAAPWHVLAALRNPPYFDFTMRSAPGEYHGFLWFYFINEQLLRFLNMRYPRDYDTVPRLYFWLFHLLWLFPWSVYFPAVVIKAETRFQAARPRRKNASAGPVLDGFHSGVLHFFHHAGILFDAVLSGARAAARIGHGCGGQLDPLRHARSVRHIRIAAARGAHAVFPVVEFPHARRYFRGAQLKSRRLQAFARPHGRPHHRFVRVSSRCRCSWPRLRFCWERPAHFAPPGSARSLPWL